MLTEKDMHEIQTMTNADLNAAIRIMRWQVKAPILVGDRDRVNAVYEALVAEFVKRGGVFVKEA